MRINVTSLTGTAALLLSTFLFVPAGFAAKVDTNHQEPFVAGPAGENHITREVRHQLVTLPYYGIFDDLAFKVEGSTVTLLGQVVNPVTKDDAEKAVKSIEGVEKVKNDIEVLPVSPNDDHIRMAEYRAIYGDPTIAPRYGYRALPSIHIIVKNGHVTLVGVVANQMDKQIVQTRAKEVPGVFSVTNNLQVEKS